MTPNLILHGRYTAFSKSWCGIYYSVLSLAATCVLLILTQIYKLHIIQECVESTSGSIFTNSSAMQWHAACPQTSPKYVCQETIHQETNWQNRDWAKRASRFITTLANEMFSSEPKFSKLLKRTPKDQVNGFLASGRMCTIKLSAIALQLVSNLQIF